MDSDTHLAGPNTDVPASVNTPFCMLLDSSLNEKPPIYVDVDVVNILLRVASDSLVGIDETTDPPKAITAVQAALTALVGANQNIARIRAAVAPLLDKMRDEQAMVTVQEEAVRGADDMPTAVRDDILSDILQVKGMIEVKVVQIQTAERQIPLLQSRHDILVDAVADVVVAFSKGGVGGVQRDLGALSIQ